MKNISFFCLLFCLTILGCDKEKNGTPKNGNGYFMYSITINGVTHKIEGNLGGYLTQPLYGSQNFCFAQLLGGVFFLEVQANLQGLSSFVSGEPFTQVLDLTNPQSGYLGAYRASISHPTYLAATNLNYPLSYCGFQEPWSNSQVLNISDDRILVENFYISSVGSAPANNNWGDPVIGSFSGTVYGCSQPSNLYNQNIPLQLEIEFVAPRYIF